MSDLSEVSEGERSGVGDCGGGGWGWGREEWCGRL